MAFQPNPLYSQSKPVVKPRAALPAPEVNPTVQASELKPDATDHPEPKETAEVVTVRLYGRQTAKVDRLAKRYGLSEIGRSAAVRRIIDEFPE